MSVRVAYVCADGGVPIFGNKGASVHVQEVVRALRRAGADVEIFASRCDAPAAGRLQNVRCHALPAPDATDAARREQNALALNGILAQLLENAGPFDLVYERYSLWSTAAMHFARQNGLPGLLEVNAPLVDEQAAHRVLVDRAAAEQCAADAFGAAGAVLAVSTAVADYVRRCVDGAKVHVVPNGVDADRFTPHVGPSWPAAPGVLTLGFVGSLKPWHGVDVLVDAFERVHAAVPNSRLLIVGDGPERWRAERARRDSASVVLTGAVPAGTVPSLLASMDVAAAPYPDRRDFYFSPLKVLEYMAAGLPVVASRIGQVAEVIDHERTGILCPAGDAAAVAGAVVELFRDPARRRRIGAAARRRACEAHSWDAVASRILEISAAIRQTPGGALVEAR